MSNLLTSLGLRANSTLAPIPIYAPHFIIANFILSYAIFSTRGAKLRLGLDHNVSPRYDVTKYGEAAVQKGKITQEQLDKLKRQEAAHANAIENFPLFVGAVIAAMQAKLPNEMVNRYALVYTVMRIVYNVLYVQINESSASYARSAVWWAGNITCIRLFWFAGKAFNAGL